MIVFRLFSLCIMSLAFLLVASAWGVNANPEPEGQFRQWIKTWEGSGITVTVGATSYDATSDRLEIRNLAFSSAAESSDRKGQHPTAGSPVLTVEKAVISSFSSGKDGIAFKMGRIEGLNLQFGTKEDVADARISMLNLSDAFLPNFTGFAFDQDRPFSSQINFLKLFQKAAAKSATGSGLRFGKHLSAESLRLADLTDGQLGSASLSGAVVEMQPASGVVGQSAKVLASELTISNLNSEAYLRLFDANAYLEAGSARPWRSVISKMVAQGVDIQFPDVSGQIDVVEMSTLKARQFAQNLSGPLDLSAGDPEYFANNPTIYAQFSASIRESFGIENVGVRAVDLSFSTGSGSRKIKLERGNLSNFLATHIDDLDLIGLDYFENDGGFKLGALTVSDINVTPPAYTAGADEGRSEAAAFPQISRVNAKGLDANIGNSRFSVNKIELVMSYFVATTPTNVNFSLQNLRFPVQQISSKAVQKTLLDFGYQDIDLSLAIAGSWQERSSEIAVANAMLSVSEMGSLSTSGSLTGITRAAIQNPTGLLLKDLQEGGLKNFRLSFQNDSVFDRYLKIVSKENGMAIDQIKKILSTNMPMIMSAVADPAIRNKLIFAGVSFVNEGVGFNLVSTTNDTVMIKDVVDVLSEPLRMVGLLKLDARPMVRN